MGFRPSERLTQRCTTGFRITSSCRGRSSYNAWITRIISGFMRRPHTRTSLRSDDRSQTRLCIADWAPELHDSLYSAVRTKGPTLSPVSLLCFMCEPSQ